MATILKVSVWRGGKDGAFQDFEVPREASQTVLDVVTHIQRALDPTLAYRFACRVGMCGSCAMTVNGCHAGRVGRMWTKWFITMSSPWGHCAICR